ncbi:MAG: flavodoxin [Actinobacteria bacterium HGW-Actinobacteria-4]|nr:MAG: flavodoxin [Actinobacteria bacterium HGW-Actinobacteria-4]
MHALVVYESMFGNTEEVARAISDGMSSHMSVTAVEVGHAPSAVPLAVDLLVVGGPTHAFSMSRESTRKDAIAKTPEPLVSQGAGIREWIDGLKRDPGLLAATFDTKVSKPSLPGSAAAKAAKHLAKTAHASVLEHQTFWVGGMTGPLADGELDRARDWGKELAIRAEALAD